MSDLADHPSTIAVTPVVRELLVQAPADVCFRVFVDGFATWWPPEHHIGEGRTITGVAIEPRPGGRCYDTDTTGFECQWGTVLVSEPPQRLVLAWHIQGDWTIDLDPAHQSEVTITFTALDDRSTQVRLVHDHIDRHRLAPGIAQGISRFGGWTGILLRFADALEGRTPRSLA